MRLGIVLGLAGLSSLLVGVVPAQAAVPTCAGHRATIVGTPGNDTIRGTRRADVIVAGAGNDTVRGLGGDDRICGGPGADRLFGGAGRDRLYGGLDRLYVDDALGQSVRQGDRLRGGPGADRLVPGHDGRSADIVRGDAILWDTAPRAVHVDLGRGVALGEGRDTFDARGAWVVGSRFADVFDGSARADHVQAGAGADVVRGNGGADYLEADTPGPAGGADVVTGGPGNDRIYVGGGRDLVHAGAGNDYVSVVGSSTERVFGDAGNDQLDVELVRGDHLDGGAGRDRLSLRTNLAVPAASTGTGFWDLGAGTVVVDHGSTHVAASTRTLEAGYLDTPNVTWHVVGSNAADEIDASFTAGTVFDGRAGDDIFTGSPADDVFDGQGGTDHSPGMGDGTDTCHSVETLDQPDCETVTP